MYPKVLLDLIDQFKKLPGVGSKTAERYALALLLENEESIDTFAQSLINCKKKIKKCEICHNLSDDTLCDICKDKNRDVSTICVVASSKDIIAMEKMQEYHGTYHCLDGLICTSKGIFPEDLNIESLLERINENTKEVILALNATVDGEMTALYLDKILKNYNVLVTRIGYGIPIGAHLDYADELTLIKAFEGRKEI